MLEISYKSFPTTFSVALPISKSIVARQLLLDYIYKNPLAHRIDQLKGFHLPDDIRYLLDALKVLEQRRDSNGEEVAVIHSGQSGTAYRFLSVLSLFEKHGVIIITDPQLTQRITQIDQQPFLNIGARIEFLSEEHKTIIHPTDTIGGEIDGKVWRTSQYISALLLTESLHKGMINFKIDIEGPSFSYIQLTKEVIRQYRNGEVKSEGDWSAASYWYQLMVLHPEIEELYFMNLNPHSSQPDHILTDIYQQFGINTDSGNRLKRAEKPVDKFKINISQSLDLFPSIVLTAVHLGIPFEISGVRNLRIKESNRIESVLQNLQEIGINNVIQQKDKVVWTGERGVPRETNRGVFTINSFDDHRMAMAFGVFATANKGEVFRLMGEECVAKSYPNFFEELLSI